MLVSFNVCLFIHKHVLRMGEVIYSHLVCQALTSSPEAARDLQVNKPETRGGAQHTHAHVLTHRQSNGLMLSRRRLPLPPLHRLALSALPISHTLEHTLAQKPLPHLTPTLLSKFCFFDFSFPCIDKTLHTETLCFVFSLLTFSLLKICGGYVLKQLQCKIQRRLWAST